MAAMAAKEIITCLVCLKDDGVMKTIGPCDHAFCSDCLANHLKKLLPGDEVFQCPTCKRDCRLPAAGVDGLVDAVSGQKATKANQKPVTGTERCRICKFKGSDSKAKNRCTECNDLDMCEGCSAAHKSSSATSSHLLNRLTSPIETGENMCSKHNEPFIRYCRTCYWPVCSLCIVLEHGDHEVWKAEVLYDTTKKKLVNSKKKAEKIQRCKAEMSAAMDNYCMLRNSTIRDIKSKAEECITKIQQQKDEFIAEVKAVSKVNETEENLIKAEQVMEAIANANDADGQLELQVKEYGETKREEYLLFETTKHSTNVLEGLLKLDAHYEAALSTDVNWEAHMELPRHAIPTFTPKAEQDLDLGKLEQPPFLGWSVVQNWKELAECHIRNVVIFGQDSFALLLGVQPGPLADRIKLGHIRNQRQTMTIKENPYDISATPSGCLAVLCSGLTEGHIGIKLYDEEGLCLRSLGQVNIPDPLSMSVSMLGEYVILSKPGDNEYCITAVTVLDMPKQNQKVDTYSMRLPLMNGVDMIQVSCGGRYTLIIGTRTQQKTRHPYVEMYEILVQGGNITQTDRKTWLEGSIGEYLIPMATTSTDDAYYGVKYHDDSDRKDKNEVVKISDKGDMMEEPLNSSGIKIEGRMHIRGNIALVSDNGLYALYRLTNE